MKHVIHLLVLITLSSASAVAVGMGPKNDGPYTYEMWKKRIYIDAQNKASKIMNNILEMKSNQFEDSAESLGNEDQRSALAQERKDAIMLLESEKDLALAQLEDAKSFTYDQYLTVYVRSLGPEDLRAWSEKINPESVQELVRLYIRSKQSLPQEAFALNPEGFKEFSSADAENIIKN